MSDSRPWEEYTEIAERTLNRCNMKDPHKQTVHYVSVILWTESELADLEKEISDISPVNPLHWGKLKQARNEYAELSLTVHSIQKTTSKPDSYLHELIDRDQDEVENTAVSQILTQLGWEFFPRHLSRFLDLHERVGSRLDSKKQQLLTTCIILVSLVAILISMSSIVVTILL